MSWTVLVEFEVVVVLALLLFADDVDEALLAGVVVLAVVPVVAAAPVVPLAPVVLAALVVLVLLLLLLPLPLPLVLVLLVLLLAVVLLPVPVLLVLMRTRLTFSDAWRRGVKICVNCTPVRPTISRVFGEPASS